MAGYGLYWRCNEFIGTKVTHTNKNCILEQDLEILSYDCNLPVKKIQEILEYFVEVGLYTKTPEGKYQNLKINTRLTEWLKRELRLQEKQAQESLRIASGGTQESLHTTSRGTPALLQLKEKKRKEIKRKEMKTLGHTLTDKSIATKEKEEKTKKEEEEVIDLD